MGYTGGTYPNRHMRCLHGITGRAEAVLVRYDPKIISYEELLSIFWRAHDPTTLNQLGQDIGTQYRSAIFYHNDTWRAAAREIQKEFDRSGVYINEAVSQIVPASTFYIAEDYHQDYFEKHGGRSCHVLRKK